MNPLYSIQIDQIDKAIRDLDPLSQAEGAERSDDEYNDLREMIIALLESGANKVDLIRAVSAKIGFMGVPENSVDVEGFIAKVLKIAGRPDSE